MVKTFKYRGETFAWYDTTTGCTDEIPSPVMLETSDRFGDGPLQFCDYLLATSPDWEKMKQRYAWLYTSKKDSRCGEVCDGCTALNEDVETVLWWHDGDEGRIVLVVTK